MVLLQEHERERERDKYGEIGGHVLRVARMVPLQEHERERERERDVWLRSEEKVNGERLCEGA